MKETGRNDPCPCGSGRKYKKCCLETDETTARAARREAADEEGLEDHHHHGCECPGGHDDTYELAGRLGWESFDFGIDPYDPFIDDLLFGPPADENDPIDEEEDLEDEDEDERVGACLSPAAYRFVRGETRARLLEELERRVEAAGLPDDPMAREAIRLVADESYPPMGVGFLRDLFAGSIEEVQERRCRVDDEEERGLDEDLVEEAHLVATRDRAAAASFLERLAPLGDGAFPYVEECLISAPMGDRAIPLLEFLAARPTVRSLSLALFALATDATGSVRDAVFDVLFRAPRTAWPMLLYFCQVRWRPADERLAAYDLLVRAREPEVVFSLLEEFDSGAPWNEPIPDERLEHAADLLAGLGDRRAIGRLLRMEETFQLRKGARGAIDRAFERVGWAAEFEAARKRISQGKRILIPSEEEDLEEAEERGEELYLETLDWLRPADLAAPGPDELRLGLDFARWLAEEFGQDGEVEDEELERRQEEWMTTRGVDGRIPMAVIQHERDREPRHPGFARDRREWLLADLYREAREALDDGDEAGARRRLETLLEIEPEHPFGRRLTGRLPRG